jgi:acylphosphatase
MKRVVAVVSGHVQGVGYRWFVRELASAAGLAGSATNLPDGRVEVVVEGPEDDVAALVAALDGPRAPGAVRRVDHRSAEVQGSTGFTTA